MRSRLVAMLLAGDATTTPKNNGLDDIQPSVLLFKHGVLINVPAPARFAFHKLVVSQRRRASDIEKIKRDIAQSEQLFQSLIEGRPGDLILAYEATEKMGEKFNLQLKSGMALIDKKIKETVYQILELQD